MTLDNLIGKGLTQEPTSPAELDRFREKIRLLDQFRRERAAGLYDGSFSPSDAELTALIGEVEQLWSHFERWLTSTHPELT